MGILLKLTHPNINPLLGMFRDDEGYHMVSPWLKSGSVHSCILNDVPFDGVKVVSNLSTVHFRRISNRQATPKASRSSRGISLLASK